MQMTNYKKIRNKKMMCGTVKKLTKGSVCEAHDGIIWYDKYPLCKVHSQDAYDYFARDDDGCGIRRGQLTQAIRDELAKVDDDHQARWDKIWDDTLCRNFRRTEFEDYWLWNDDFYSAPIITLQYIAGLIGIKDGKENES